MKRLLLALVLATPSGAGLPSGADADGRRWVEVPRDTRLAAIAAETGVPWEVLAAANRDLLAGDRPAEARLHPDGRRRLRLHLDLPRADEPAPEDPPRKRLAFGGSFRDGFRNLMDLLRQWFASLGSSRSVSLRPRPRPSSPAPGSQVRARPSPRDPAGSSGVFGTGSGGFLGSIFGKDPNRTGAPSPRRSSTARGRFNERLPLERGSYRISSRFGSRSGRHLGIDLAAAAGVPIVSTGPAVVRRSALSASYGNVVYLDHVDGDRLAGVQTRYAHMRRTPRVRQNLRMTLPAGTRLGEVGSTGRSTGNHLHFEVRKVRHSLPLGAAASYPNSAAADPAHDFRF